MTTGTHDIELSDANFTNLKAIVYQNTGITIGDNRKSMLFSRLRGRLRELGEPNFKSYISRVKTEKEEMVEFIDRVTTNKTYFYRTPRVWDHFQNTLIPAFLTRGIKRPMRTWSAASSTGEEAHTIGILLEDVRNTHKDFEYSVLGTDVSPRVVKEAAAGCYSKTAVAQFKLAKPTLFQTHMTGNDADGFKVTKPIKSRLKFSEHNLQKRLKVNSAFDAVFLRNVLIYFAAADQENILRHVHSMMPETGILYIGESETLTSLKTDFEMIAPMVYKPRNRQTGSGSNS